MMEQNLFDFRPNQTCLGDHNDEEEMGRGGKTTSGNEWTGLEFGKSQRAVAVSYTHLTLPTMPDV